MKTARAITILLLSAILLSTVSAQTPLMEEWWERPSPIILSDVDMIVGVCYPWLVTKHKIINLATGEVAVGTGGDAAVSVEACGTYFVVKAISGVYVFSKMGLIVDFINLGQGLSYIGSSSDTIAVYDSSNSVVYVKILGSRTTVLIPVPDHFYEIDYSFIQLIPVVAFSADGRYYITSPGGSREINVTGTGALLMHGNRLYVESHGVLALEVDDPLMLTYRELFYIPLPVRLSRILSIINDYLLASAGETLIMVNVNEKSSDFRKVVVVGSAVPTPVGFYVPSARTTYVIVGGVSYPVPGYATARLNNIVFTNIIRGDSELTQPVPAMWALVSSTLVLTAAFDGMLYDGQYAVRLKLPPGTYRAPRGAVITDGVRSIVLINPEVFYPPTVSSDVSLGTTNIRYHVIDFPPQYLSLEAFHDVRYVSSGSGRLLLVQRDRALVYSEYGVTASIPGVWRYGGVGDCVVLYDGGAFRLYDYGGEPITSYAYYLIENPDYVTCRRVHSREYAVEVYVDGFQKKITITASGARVESNPERAARDPKGTVVFYTQPPRIEYSGFVIPVPSGATSIHVSYLWATWRVGTDIYILSIPDSAIYVLLSAPGVIYPISSELVALYDGRSVMIIPFKQWFIQNCYIDVNVPQEASLFVNGRLVSVGPSRVYTPCNVVITLEARMQYHKPKTVSLRVTGPMNVTLTPEPMIANVVLNVSTPPGLVVESVVVSVNGDVITWNVGETRSMPARPTTFEVLSFYPIDACVKETYNMTLVEGLNVLNVRCRLIMPVLTLTSSAPAIVEMYYGDSQQPTIVTRVTPREPAYVIPPLGGLRVVSKPAVKGYVQKELYLSITDVRVYELDVTPHPMSKIIVNSNVPTSTITVYDESGVVVASGVGSLEAEVMPGRYTVVSTAEGYTMFSTLVDVPPGDVAVVSAIHSPMQIEAPEEPPPWRRIEFQLLAAGLVIAAMVLVLIWRHRRAKKMEEETLGGE